MMNIEHARYALPPVAALRPKTEGAAEAVPARVAAPAQAAQVSISGKALVLQRLFEVSDPALEPPVKTQDAPGAFIMPSELFLTRTDRDFFARIYEFAQEQNADLRFVDSLAFHLGEYRFHRDGKNLSAHNIGQYDLEGHHVTHHFTEKDTITAQRILASEALNTTEMDKGFILRMTNEDYHGINHTHLEFLEAVINRFSNHGAGTVLDGRFARHEWIAHDYIKRVSAYQDPDYIMNRDKEKLAPSTETIEAPAAMSIPAKPAERPILSTLFDLLAQLKR